MSVGKKKLTRKRCTAALDAFTTFRSVVTKLIHTTDRHLAEYEEAVGLASFDPRPNMVLGIGVVLQQRPLNLLALLRATCVEPTGLAAFRVHRMESTQPQDKITGSLDWPVTEIPWGSCQITGYLAMKYTKLQLGILREGNLSVLSLCQLPKKIPSLPSWVPDFSMPLKLYLQTAARSYEPFLLPRYCASGESQPRIEFSRTIKLEPLLGLDGVVVDNVRTMGKKYTEIADSGGNIVDWSQEWTRVLLDLSRLPVKGGGKNHTRNEHLLWVIRTSTADATSNEKGENSRGNEEGLKAAAMLQCIGADEDTVRAHGVLDILERNGMPPRVDRESFAEVGGCKYIGMILTRARGREPFVTSQGHLGLGPWH
jgi:hypothetical protein